MGTLLAALIYLAIAIVILPLLLGGIMILIGVWYRPKKSKKADKKE